LELEIAARGLLGMFGLGLQQFASFSSAISFLVEQI
jgi:hypothetical protein